MELERNENLSATAHNLHRSDEKLGDFIGIRAAHLREISHAILRGAGKDADSFSAFSDRAREIYRELRSETSGKVLLADELMPEAEFSHGALSLFDTLCICRGVALGVTPSERDLREAISGEQCGDYPQREVRVAFAAGREANVAFENFAKFFSSAMPEGEENFQSACDLVSDGSADFCMIPVENSSDGRLGGFYRLIEKNGLYIVSACRVQSRDGENYTKFALCARNMISVGNKGEKIFHFRVTLERMAEAENLFSAARFFGADVKRCDTVPPALSGRDNSLDIILGVDSCDICGLLCFLKFEFPQLSPIGLYVEIGGEEI